MPTTRVLVLALVCLLLLIGCGPASDDDAEEDDGEVEELLDSDSDGVSDEEEIEAGTDPDDPDDVPVQEVEPEGEPEMEFEPTEAFDANVEDTCDDGTSAVECTGELDSCEAGMVGGQPALRCDDVEPRDGTVVSVTIQRQAVTADGIDIRHACQAEPEPGLTSCIFDVLDNGQSIFGQGCEYDGDLLDDALVLVLPTTCGAVPEDVSQRIADSIDLSGQTSYAAAFLTDEGQPIYLRVGVMLPVELEDAIETIESAR